MSLQYLSPQQIIINSVLFRGGKYFVLRDSNENKLDITFRKSDNIGDDIISDWFAISKRPFNIQLKYNTGQIEKYNNYYYSNYYNGIENVYVIFKLKQIGTKIILG